MFKETKKEVEQKFIKEQFLNSKTYANKVDVINTVMSDDELTKAELDNKIEKFMKGKVK